MNQKEDILNNGGLENLTNYTIFKRKTPGNKKYNLINKKCLDMWHMKIVKNNNPKINYKYWVCVAGYLKDGTYIESSPILDAESPRVVVSENSRYYLKYNTTIQKKLPHPSFNVDELNKFLNGFPKDWKSIIKEQILRIYGKDCVISQSTEKKIYANIQKTDELFDVLHKNIFENGSDSNRTVKVQHVDSNHHLVKDHLKGHKKLRNFYLDDTNIEISSYKEIFRKNSNQNRMEEFNYGRYNRSDTAIMFYNQEDMFANKDIEENRNNKTSFHYDANYQCGGNNQSYYSPYKNSYLHEKSTTENQINNMSRYPESKDISTKNSTSSHPYDVDHHKTISGTKKYSEGSENDCSERHDFGKKLFKDRKKTNRNDSKSNSSVKQSNKKKEIFRIERPNDLVVIKEVKRQDTINSKYPIIKIKGADIAVADFSKKAKDSDYTSFSFKNTEKRKFVLDELDEDSEKVENSSEDSNNSSYKKEEAMKLEDKKILYDDIILNQKTVEFKNSGTDKNIKLIINEKDNDLPMLNSENCKNVEEIGENKNDVKISLDVDSIYYGKKDPEKEDFKKEDVYRVEDMVSVDVESHNLKEKQREDDHMESVIGNGNEKVMRRKSRTKNRKSIDISTIMNSLTEDDIKNTSRIINPVKNKDEMQDQMRKNLTEKSVFLKYESEGNSLLDGEKTKLADFDETKSDDDNALVLEEPVDKLKYDLTSNLSEKEEVTSSKEKNLADDSKSGDNSFVLDEILSVNLDSIEDSCETSVSRFSDCSFKRRISNPRKKKTKKCMPKDFKFIEKKLMREERRTSMSGRTVFYKREE